MQEFYQLNPKLLLRYLPYMKAQRRNRQDEMSDIGWTNGLYVSRAIGSALSKRAKYPESPLQLYQTNDPEEKKDGFTDADRFAAFATMFNKQFADRKKKEAEAESGLADGKKAETESGTESEAGAKPESGEVQETHAEEEKVPLSEPPEINQ